MKTSISGNTLNNSIQQRDTAFQHSRMFMEAKESAVIVDRQLQGNSRLVKYLAEQLRADPPHAIITCARGSSDHAATFAKYLFETNVSILTSSAAPSVSSVYSADQNLQNTLFLAISQSGQSPDLIATTKAAKRAGAYTVALLNVVNSPLAGLVDQVIPLHAGPETSIAATKSYIATLTVILQLITYWTGDDVLLNELSRLPALLNRAWELNWEPVVLELIPATNLFVVARGPCFAIAQEAALKFKETCGLHAEAFSAAEIKHGPMALVEKEFPVLVFSQNDQTRSDISKLVHDFTTREAAVMLAGQRHPQAINLPVLEGVYPALEPLLFIQSFYRMVNHLAFARSHDPDHPPHLKKVTETM